MAKTFIPLSGLSLTIQGISEVFRCIICIQTGHWPARSVVAAEETEKMLMRTSQDEDQKMLFNLTNPEIAIMMMAVFLLLFY